MSGLIRSVLGDLPATASLGRCDAHEHVVLGGPFVEANYPELDLSDTDAAVVELTDFAEAGGGWIVDAMPTSGARRPDALAEVSRRSGVPIVMSTGRHLAQYDPPDDPHRRLDREALAAWMIREIRDGVNGIRCGAIKVAGGRGGLSDDEREAFIAAAQVQRETGCPILTHTEADGPGVWDQVRTLLDHGADASKVVLSHLDQNTDAALHRDVLASGVCLEYDQHFRRLLKRDTRSPGPFELIAQVVDSYPDRVVLGMDLARRAYWAARGGSPGLTWFLHALPAGLRSAGLSNAAIDRLFIDNPIRAFRFANDSMPDSLSPVRSHDRETRR
ncbi:MAG: phosphotriesterase family protein [Phycisphaeraceae bacterium]